MNKVTSSCELSEKKPKLGQIYVSENGEYYQLCYLGYSVYICCNLGTGQYWRPYNKSMAYACRGLELVPPGTKITIEVGE